MDADHHAGDLLGAFRLEHLEALMPAHNIPRDLVPDDGIHIPEIVQGAPDFLVSRVARLQILAGIIFCRFQHENGHFLNVYFRLYRWQKAHKINPFERPGAIFLRSEKTLYFCEIFHGRAPRSRRKRSRRFDPPWGRKADHAPGLSPSKVQKPTAPRDFCTAKCESRQRPGLCCGEVRKPTSLPGVSHGEARKPTRAQDFFTAKRKSRPRRPPLPGSGLLAARPAPAAAKTVRFLIPRGKASFYETATFRRRKVLFSSPFCGLLFGPGRAKLTVPAGKSPPPEPRPPRGGPPNDRDRLPFFAPPARTPAPATPPQSACSRRRSGRPQRPNLFGRRLPESPKGKGKGKEEARMERAPPL